MLRFVREFFSPSFYAYKKGGLCGAALVKGLVSYRLGVRRRQLRFFYHSAGGQDTRQLSEFRHPRILSRPGCFQYLTLLRRC